MKLTFVISCYTAANISIFQNQSNVVLHGASASCVNGIEPNNSTMQLTFTTAKTIVAFKKQVDVFSPSFSLTKADLKVFLSDPFLTIQSGLVQTNRINISFLDEDSSVMSSYVITNVVAEAAESLEAENQNGLLWGLVAGAVVLIALIVVVVLVWRKKMEKKDAFIEQNYDEMIVVNSLDEADKMVHSKKVLINAVKDAILLRHEKSISQLQLPQVIDQSDVVVFGSGSILMSRSFDQ